MHKGNKKARICYYGFDNFTDAHKFLRHNLKPQTLHKI